jgi:hypothetical protein
MTEETNAIRGYTSPKHFGTRDVTNVLDGEVVVQEKIDGSQCRFLLNDNGTLSVFSRGGARSLEDMLEDGLFGPCTRHFILLQQAGRLVSGRVYCGEAVAKPKHNILAYERTPKGNFVMFDIWDLDAGRWISPSAVAAIATSLDVEPVPELHVGEADLERLQKLISGPSVLGGVREGIVVKNYANGQFAKLVAAEFQEVSGRNGRKVKLRDATEEAFYQKLAAKYGPQPRMLKAVQHLRDEGLLDESSKDIGPLIREFHADILKECKDELMEELFETAWKRIAKYLGPNMASWYKERLSKIGGASEDYIRHYDGTVTKETEEVAE